LGCFVGVDFFGAVAAVVGFFCVVDFAISFFKKKSCYANGKLVVVGVQDTKKKTPSK
jgi:hypothetical protein